MTPTPYAEPETTAGRQTSTWVRCVLIGTLVVGLADFVQSFILFSVMTHRPAFGILQGPATGLLGREAMQGGLKTAAIGTLLHFAIACAWVTLFAAAYRGYPALRSFARANSGLMVLSIGVGVVVWLTMDWFVLRFSRAHYYRVSEPYFWYLLVGHIPFVGFPLVWSVRRFAPR